MVNELVNGGVRLETVRTSQNVIFFRGLSDITLPLTGCIAFPTYSPLLTSIFSLSASLLYVKLSHGFNVPSTGVPAIPTTGMG